MQHMMFVYATPEAIVKHISQLPGIEAPEQINNGYRLNVRRSQVSFDVRKNLDAEFRKEPSIKLLSKHMGGPAETIVDIDTDPGRAKEFLKTLESRLKERGVPYFSGTYAHERFEYGELYHP